MIIDCSLRLLDPVCGAKGPATKNKRKHVNVSACGMDLEVLRLVLLSSFLAFKQLHPLRCMPSTTFIHASKSAYTKGGGTKPKSTQNQQIGASVWYLVLLFSVLCSLFAFSLGRVCSPVPPSLDSICAVLHLLPLGGGEGGRQGEHKSRLKIDRPNGDQHQRP